MAAGINLLSRGIGMIQKAFGTEQVTIEGFPSPITVDWNDLGRTEQIIMQGKRVSFSATLDATANQFPHSPVQGQRVTRLKTGAVFRITGPIHADGLTYRFILDSVNK